MIATLQKKSHSNRNSFWNKTAGELMTPNPSSIHEYATLSAAANFFSDKQISAAPVINIAGRPVGVVGRTDLVRHLSAMAMHSHALQEVHGQDGHSNRDNSKQQRDVQSAQVSEIMTPTIYAVPEDTPMPAVIDEMLGRGVHRLFVLDSDGLLVGVISTLDVLRATRNLAITTEANQ